MIAALGMFLVLALGRSMGFLSYLLKDPSSIDGLSVGIWLWWGLAPGFIAILTWATSLGLVRKALARLGAAPKNGLEDISAAALGLAFLGQAVFILGWARCLTPSALAVLAVITALALAVAAVRRHRGV